MTSLPPTMAVCSSTSPWPFCAAALTSCKCPHALGKAPWARRHFAWSRTNSTGCSSSSYTLPRRLLSLVARRLIKPASWCPASLRSTGSKVPQRNVRGRAFFYRSSSSLTHRARTFSATFSTPKIDCIECQDGEDHLLAGVCTSLISISTDCTQNANARQPSRQSDKQVELAQPPTFVIYPFVSTYVQDLQYLLSTRRLRRCSDALGTHTNNIYTIVILMATCLFAARVTPTETNPYTEGMTQYMIGFTHSHVSCSTPAAESCDLYDGQTKGECTFPV